MKNKAVKLVIAEQPCVDPKEVSVEFTMCNGVCGQHSSTPVGNYTFKYKLEPLQHEIEECETMKEFGRGMYIDGTTVAECGEDVWNKFRQYVEEKLSGDVEITGHYSRTGEDCCIALDNDNLLRWFTNGSPFTDGEEYTKQNILDILTHYGYIEPSEHKQEKYKMFTRDMLKPGMFCKQRNGVVFVVADGNLIVDVTGDDTGEAFEINWSLQEDLTNTNDSYEYDVVTISHTFDFASTIWERDVKEEEREKIRQEIAEIEASLKAKKEALENI